MENLNSALKYPDPAWGYFHALSRQDLMLMDRLLVDRQHPLAMECGTQWDRFRKLHAQGYQF